MDVEKTILLIIWILVFFYLPIFILFYRSRFQHPIKGRFPRAALLEATITWIMIAIECLSTIFDGNCSIPLATGFFFVPIIEDLRNYRFMQLLFLYKIAENIAQTKDRKFEDWQLNWFTTHRHFIGLKFGILAITISFFINFILFFGMLHFINICKTSLFTTIFTLSTTVRICLTLFIAYKIWKFPNDAYGMKSEFKMIALSFIIIAPFSMLRSLIKNMKYLNIFLQLVASHALINFSIVLPYRKSLKSDTIDDMTLKEWLNRPNGTETFAQYLQTEFSEENILFWLEVNQYKKIPKTDANIIKDSAEQIVKKYINLDAPYRLNLPHTVMISTTEKFEILQHKTSSEAIDFMESLNLFDEAQFEIYQLMSSDSWTRFRSTAIYIQIRKEMNGPTNMAEVEILLHSHRSHPVEGEEPQLLNLSMTGKLPPSPTLRSADGFATESQLSPVSSSGLGSDTKSCPSPTTTTPSPFTGDAVENFNPSVEISNNDVNQSATQPDLETEPENSWHVK